MSSTNVSGATRLHPFPTILRSGVLVLILGMTSVSGVAVAVYPNSYIIYFVGIVAAALAFTFFKDRYRYGRPTTVQLIAIYVALVLGVLLLIGLFVFMPDYGSRNFLLVLFLIIGIVFIPLGIASGPLMLLLAGLCIVNALLGLWLHSISFSIFGLVDGVLKFIFSGLMLRTRPVIVPAPAAQADIA